MEYIAVITQFNQSAIQNKLTGLQMQLWYAIFAKVCEGKQDVYISTAELLEQLQVSRCQFQRARSGLIQAGLLAMRKESNQKVFYTVQLNEELLVTSNLTETTVQTTVWKETMIQQTMELPTAEQKQTRTLYPKATDVLADGSYRNEIAKFCRDLCFDSTKENVVELETELMNWCMMRKENGWQLTKQGLEALLEKLKAISSETVTIMLEIVRTSIRRRWKGFYELRTESKPSGEKLLAMEQAAQKSSSEAPYWNERNRYSNRSSYSNTRNRKTNGRLPKYDTKIEDLDFLEW